MAEPDPNKAPEIPGYEILREIGSGGMARVYLAVQQSLSREVALKVMIPGLSVDEISCHRFLKEGRIAAQLNHQNLLTVYDIGVHDEQYYMASEFLSGGTVRDRMSGGLSDEEVIRIISDTAQGLQYAHSKGFVHRDVKPGNLLFRANGECVLGDFGIAKSVDSTTNATQLGTSIGTPHYMSPEQAKGEKVDHRTDLYSLGVVFYELLVGKPPFDGDDPFTVALAQINQPVPQIEGARSRFQALVEGLMKKDREERFESAEAFLDQLEVLTGHVGPARKTTRKKVKSAQQSPGSGSTSGGKSRLLVGVALIAMMAVGVWAVIQGLDLGDGDAGSGSGAGSSRSAEVASLLTEARSAIGSRRFFAPDGQAAIDHLEAALRLEPGNAAARTRLDGLVNEAADAAEALWEAGEVDEAKRIISEGLKRYPSNMRLRDLLARSDAGTSLGGGQAQPQPAESNEVRATLQRAQRFFDVGEYMEATRLYKQVLTLDPSNGVAEAQLDQIADNWVAVAERFFAEGQLDQASNMVRQGLAARPDHPALNALLEQIGAARP